MTMDELASDLGVSKKTLYQHFPDGKEQLSSKYLGTSAKRGALAKALKDTADFLREQKTIRAAATIGTIEKGINPSYLEKAVR